jgi:hypothetical protein
VGPYRGGELLPLPDPVEVVEYGALFVLVRELNVALAHRAA